LIGEAEEAKHLAGEGYWQNLTGLTSDDLSVNFQATRAFVRALSTSRLSAEDAEAILCYKMIVAPRVRLAVARHEPCDNAVLLRHLDVPVLATQGLADSTANPTSVNLILSSCRRARWSLYESVGHCPFIELPERFNTELMEFSSRAHNWKAHPRRPKECHHAVDRSFPT
jgi:pimeloyl-ACP methyl ester carboxylesterase